MLTRRLQPWIGKPGQSSAPVGKSLNAGANACASAVLAQCDLAPASHETAFHDAALAEAFPSSFLGVMIADPKSLNTRRGDRSDTFYQHLAELGMIDNLLRHCLPGRDGTLHPRVVRNHDDRAALVCAISALCVAAGDFTAVGNDDGWIILPPSAFVQPWARELLRANEVEEIGPAWFR
jgi:hypothetical protein